MEIKMYFVFMINLISGAEILYRNEQRPISPLQKKSGRQAVEEAELAERKAPETVEDDVDAFRKSFQEIDGFYDGHEFSGVLPGEESPYELPEDADISSVFKRKRAAAA